MSKNTDKKYRAATSLFLGLIAALPVLAMAESFTETQQFSLSDINHLELHIDHSEISITKSEEPGLTITLQQELKRGGPECVHKIKHQQSSGQLKVFTASEQRSWIQSCNIYREASIQLGKTTLQRLVLKHSHGSLTSDILAAESTAFNIGHAKLILRGLAGKRAEFSLAHSNSRLGSLEAEQVSITGQHGSLNIQALTGQLAQFDWGHGKVNIEQSKNTQLLAQQRHGAIIIGEFQGEKLQVENGHGSIEVAQAKSNNVELTNRHGAIHYTGSSEKLHFSNRHGNSHIQQNQQNFAAINGEGSHGNIILNVPKNSLCHIESNTHKGMDSHLFKNNSACDKGQGQVNLHTSHGKAQVSSI